MRCILTHYPIIFVKIFLFFLQFLPYFNIFYRIYIVFFTYIFFSKKTLYNMAYRFLITSIILSFLRFETGTLTPSSITTIISSFIKFIILLKLTK